MVYLSRNDIEVIAAQVTNDYKRQPRFQGQTVSWIDPDILACELCGLLIDHFHLSVDGSVLGLTAYDEMKVKVYGDKGQPLIYHLDGRTLLVEQTLRDDPAQQGRYHFTIMHEVAYQILERRFPHPREKVRNRVVCYRGQVQHPPIQDWNEWQADNLASALLLPVDMVWSALQRFDLRNGIEMLNRVYRPQVYERFCRMAEYLGASKQALAIRLKRLGLLKLDFLKDPYALTDIYPDEDDL